MKHTQRMVLNTSATYIRSLLSAAIALISSRWVLKALGQTDFGIFSLVGSIVIFVVFINGVMAGSAARFFAFAIGEGDTYELNKWFNAALSIHFSLAAILTIVGWPLGEYVIRNVLNIPTNRITVSIYVFRASLVSAFVSMFSVPYVAMFTARQKIFELAIFGTVQSIANLMIACIIRNSSGDRLIVYSIAISVSIVIIQLIQIVRAKIIFTECKSNKEFWFDKKKSMNIFSFALWSLVGVAGTVGRDQGSALMLNIYFGPQINAAYGIANQISTQINQLSASILNAMAPEITASEGRGDIDRVKHLSVRASKFGVIMVMLFVIPAMLEIDNILILWLGSPPAATAMFCRLILVTFLVDRLSSGYMLAVSAHGKIAGYQATVGASLILTLPLAFLFLKFGSMPSSIGIAFIVTISMASVGRVYWCKVLLKMKFKNWLSLVVFPCFKVLFGAFAITFVPAGLLKASLLRLVFSTITGFASVAFLSWHFALDDLERDYIRYEKDQLLNKLCRRS